MFPTVSAVVTTHGRPALVREALASLEAEVHPLLEVLVVDDGGEFVPPDRTSIPLEVLRARGLGVGRARNLGLAHAHGEFVIYLDDDDVALPHRVATLLSAMRRYRADLCFGMTRRVVRGGTAHLEAVPTHGESAAIVSFADLLACNPHVNAVLVRAETLCAAGGFDVDAHHFDDWAAWLRIADRGALIRRVADTVAEWRMHAAGLSGAVLTLGVMKKRILALFDHLLPSLTSENARAVLRARTIVEANDIRTYDDYANAMARETLRAAAGARNVRTHLGHRL